MDLGGQWVHGEEDNLSYEMAWPLGLLEHAAAMEPLGIFDSSGSKLPDDLGKKIINYYLNISDGDPPESYLNKSMAEYYKPK